MAARARRVAFRHRGACANSRKPACATRKPVVFFAWTTHRDAVPFGFRSGSATHASMRSHRLARNAPRE